MLKVLVTGGAGFIGSHLTEALLRSGYSVVVADDLSTGRKVYVPKVARLRKVDVRSAALRDLIKEVRPAYVCHLAAQRSAPESHKDAIKDAAINIIGTINALSASAQAGVKKFLFVSTAAVYGAAREIPASERAEIQLNSPYAVSKYSAEQYVNYFTATGGPAGVIARLANVYGPRQDAGSEGGVVARFASAIVAEQGITLDGRGDQTRDFLYVTDAVQGLLAALLDGHGIYNFGTGQELSIRELAVKIGEVAGSVPRVSYRSARPNDIPRSALSALRAKRELNWHPITPLTEGIRQTLKWYKELL